MPDSTIEFDMQIAYPSPLKETIGYKPYFGCIGRDSYGNFRLAHSSNITESNDFEAFVMESFYWFRYNADDIKARKIYRLQTALTPLSGTTPAVSMDGTPMTFISRSNGSYQYTGAITTPIGLFGRIGFGEIGSKGTPFIIKSAHLIKNGTSAFNAIGVLDSTGIPCMYDRVTKQLIYNSGTGAFIAGFDTIEQARKLATLPDVTAETDATKKSLTVSLPWEAQLVSTGVPAALQVATDRGWTITVQYREAEVDNVYYNRYAECQSREDVLAVNANYLGDLTADGEWIYPMPEMIRFENVGDFWTGFFYGSQIKKIKAIFPSCTYAQALLGAVPTIEEVDLEFPIATQVTATCRYSDNYKKVRIIAPEAIYFGYNTMGGARNFVDCEYYAPKATDLTNLCHEAMVLEEAKGEFGANAVTLTNTFAHCPKLKVFPTNYPKASTAAGMFNNCEIPGEAAIAVLNSLPTYTNDADDAHPITMGIHVDYENDPDVLAAIALADIAQTPTAEGGKGWAVTVQWNGTATTQTASTFGLRRRPVYAKLSTIELFDGTTETLLDWGHYVTSWEERGYQEFASLEEAEEYFNINQTDEV